MSAFDGSDHAREVGHARLLFQTLARAAEPAGIWRRQIFEGRVMGHPIRDFNVVLMRADLPIGMEVPMNPLQTPPLLNSYRFSIEDAAAVYAANRNDRQSADDIFENGGARLFEEGMKHIVFPSRDLVHLLEFGIANWEDVRAEWPGAPDLEETLTKILCGIDAEHGPLLANNIHGYLESATSRAEVAHDLARAVWMVMLPETASAARGDAGVSRRQNYENRLDRALLPYLSRGRSSVERREEHSARLDLEIEAVMGLQADLDEERTTRIQRLERDIAAARAEHAIQLEPLHQDRAVLQRWAVDGENGALDALDAEIARINEQLEWTLETLQRDAAAEWEQTRSEILDTVVLLPQETEHHYIRDLAAVALTSSLLSAGTTGLALTISRDLNSHAQQPAAAAPQFPGRTPPPQTGPPVQIVNIVDYYIASEGGDYELTQNLIQDSPGLTEQGAEELLQTLRTNPLKAMDMVLDDSIARNKGKTHVLDRFIAFTAAYNVTRALGITWIDHNNVMVSLKMPSPSQEHRAAEQAAYGDWVTDLDHQDQRIQRAFQIIEQLAYQGKATGDNAFTFAQTAITSILDQAWSERVVPAPAPVMVL